MKEVEGKDVTIYTAYQNKQHKICYALETSNSLKNLRSIQNGTSVVKVCEDNLSNFNEVIDRIRVDNYVKEIQNQRQIKPTLLQLISDLQVRISFLQNLTQTEQEQNQVDSSEDWQPDNEEDDSFQQQ